ncbi:MAG: aminotransferase class I/II-fold pyridoxal phosphate-dependent enzyme [Crocinitomix sp.]|nr:aminotransferase class I/II-fold pyridoxal phosphate-dependent enzyme [Crocinitomix sp.]
MKIPKSILKKLNERKESDSFRSLFIASNGIDFYSNDYLGIAKLKGPDEGLDGSTGSRLISGNSTLAEQVEREAADFFNYPSATLFNSGYAANTGLLSCLPQRGDTIIYDELCHASIRDGIQLSKADAFKFRHNDAKHLEERLKIAKGEVYVIVEGVYSMDGDEAHLALISMLCEDYGAYLIVDEAHSGGVYGGKGEGLVDCSDDDDLFGAIVFAKIITFGKAFGSHGALVLGSEELKDYLINFSRPFIYTTALPPSSIARIRFAMNAVSSAEKERLKLKENILYFRQVAEEKKVTLLDSTSPIQGVIIPTNAAVKAKAEHLLEKGFLVKAILSPTVPKGQERIRICLHSYNTQKEIAALIDAMI